VRWHKAGFRCYWRWKSRPLGGRPPIDTELRRLIRRMSMDNPLWGAPRIHGELLKLGFEIAQSSVAKYMVKRRRPPSQEWRTFVRNHVPHIAAMDLFVVPTIGFELLYGFVILRLDRRELVWINVTTKPTAEWIARQLTEAFPWDEAPSYMVRDRDRLYGTVVTRRLRAMGNPGQTRRTSLALAECLCRTADRVDPPRVLGSYRRFRRVPSTPNLAILRALLQRRQNASILGQGCANLSPGSADREHQIVSHPGWAPSPLRQGLGFSVHTSHITPSCDVPPVQ
jgi:hypothetical protein